ncbi:MAG: hypothetical protein CM1200mP26_25870 [Acidimicrobiales bacterium]|nr:MAG: hypothetical protein CM1200mP26_25870 [Acidimicrobiales bacterium]
MTRTPWPATGGANASAKSQLGHKMVPVVVPEVVDPADAAGTILSPFEGRRTPAPG